MACMEMPIVRARFRPITSTRNNAQMIDATNFATPKIQVAKSLVRNV